MTIETVEEILESLNPKVRGEVYEFLQTQPFTFKPEDSELQAVVPYLQVAIYVQKNKIPAEVFSVLLLIDEDTTMTHVASRVSSAQERENNNKLES